MFQKGDYIIYGSSGVCLVDQVGAMEIAGAVEGKLYYTLRPVYAGGSTIFTPTDNDTIVMRYILTREEAEAWMEMAEFLEPVEIIDEKRRENTYREILRQCDCSSSLRLLKTLYRRRSLRVQSGRKVAAVDERYLKMAEESLSGELAVSLGWERERVTKALQEKICKKVLTPN